MESGLLPAPVTFKDGLGERHQVVDPARNEAVEMLCLRPGLTSVPSFEFALRERVSRLSGFRHGCYGHVRSVERLKDRSSVLGVVSDSTPGVRLSEILMFAEREHVTLDIEAAVCLLRQLVPAAAMLHEEFPDISHGAISPERIIITPGARLVIVEHVLGSALEQLRYSHEQYWKDLRIALPRSAGQARFDHRADVTQLGVVALSLILGRPLGDDEYPARIGDVVASAWAISARGGLEPLPAGLRAWLTRALQIDSRNWFRSAVEAQAELERVLGESDYLAAPATLESFMTQYLAKVHPGMAAAVEKPSIPSRPVPAPPIQLQPVHVQSFPAPVSAPVAVVAHGPAPTQPVPAIRASSVPASEPPAHAPQPAWREPAWLAAAADSAPDVTELPARPKSKLWLAVAAVVLIALAGVGVAAARRYAAPSPAPLNEGTLIVNTEPPGAHVFVDGVERGLTPLTVMLKAGAHSMELRGDGAPRVMPITIAAGAQVSQYIDLPRGAATFGQLQLHTEPAGARVTVDGSPRGTSPITVSDLTPGDHLVLIESDLGSVKQTVTIEAGITASLTVPLGSPQGVPVSGWISLSAPADVQVFENKRLLGSSQTDRLMVSAGRHEFEIVNDTIGYRAMRTVQVIPGRVTSVKIEFPKGSIALNAIPWAEVWVDGDKVGDTPIGNLQLAIGPHEFVFRHPDLGEQRHAATITLNTPGRLSVDLRKK
jgi:hypothetical protein